MEGNVLFNDALNTFYLWLYGVGRNINVGSRGGDQEGGGGGGHWHPNSKYRLPYNITLWTLKCSNDLINSICVVRAFAHDAMGHMCDAI